MIERVITGGQSGVDQAAWFAAKACDLATDGWMPSGFKTEDGPRPEFADQFGAREHPSSDYPSRTKSNLELADAAIVLDGGSARSPGTKLVTNLVVAAGGKPPLLVVRCARADGRWSIANPAYDDPAWVARWLAEHDCRTLFVGGNRASKSPGLGEFVEGYLIEVFRILKGGPTS